MSPGCLEEPAARHLALWRWIWAASCVCAVAFAFGCAKPIPGSTGPSDDEVRRVAQLSCPPSWSVAGLDGMERSRDHDVVTIRCRVRLVSAIAYYAVPIRPVRASGNGAVASLERCVIFSSRLPAGQYYDVNAKRELIAAGATGSTSAWKAVFRGDVQEVPKELAYKNELRIVTEKRWVWTTLAAEKLAPPVPTAGPGEAVLTADELSAADEERRQAWNRFLEEIKLADETSQLQIQAEQAQIQMWDKTIRASANFPSATAQYRQNKAEHERNLQEINANRYSALSRQLEREARFHDAQLGASLPQ